VQLSTDAGDDAEGLAVYWSTDTSSSGGEVAYEPLPTTVVDGGVRAEVDHFSRGFAGTIETGEAPDATTDATLSPDTPPFPDTSRDAGTDTEVTSDTSTPNDTADPTDAAHDSDTARRLDTTAEPDASAGTRHVGVGNFHSCVVRSDRTVDCWGFGPDPTKQEQSVLASDHDQGVPPSGETFQALSGGSNSTCGIRTNGELSCWGVLEESLSLSGTFSHIDVGGASVVCGIRPGGKLECSGTTNPHPNKNFKDVGASTHVCAVQQNGTIVCWGEGSDPDPNTMPALQKDQVVPPSGNGYEDVSVTRKMSCATKSGGGLECWGDGLTNEPVSVSNDTFVDIDTADKNYVVCGVRASGSVDCWKVGGQTATTRNSASAGEFDEVAVSDYHACAVGPSGVECWFTQSSYENGPFDEGQADVMAP
jgi:hypothetical protein